MNTDYKHFHSLNDDILKDQNNFFAGNSFFAIYPQNDTRGYTQQLSEAIVKAVIQGIATSAGQAAAQITTQIVIPLALSGCIYAAKSGYVLCNYAYQNATKAIDYYAHPQIEAPVDEIAIAGQIEMLTSDHSI